jgi:hypothetical protein
MEKITRNFEVKYSLEWKYGVEISQIKNDIEELEKLGATHVEIDIEYEHGDSYIEIKALSNRLETDDEYQQRIDEQNKRQEDMKRRELEQLEKLKSKYGL